MSWIETQICYRTLRWQATSIEILPSLTIQSCGVVGCRGVSYCKVPVVCRKNGFPLFARSNAVLNTSGMFLNLLQPTPQIQESVAPWCTSFHCFVYASLDATFLPTLGQAESSWQHFWVCPACLRHVYVMIAHQLPFRVPYVVSLCKRILNPLIRFLCFGDLFNSSFRTPLVFSPEHPRFFWI